MPQPNPLVPALLVVTLAWPASAAAQLVDLAEVLFDKGVADMEAKRFHEACPAIEQSYQLDPRLGTLFTLAECEAERGRIATAVARYEEYLALFAMLPPDKQDKQRDREKTSRAQKAALGPQLPALTLKLPPEAPPGTMVRRDGAELAQTSLGVAFPVDPGEHLVTTQAPGGPVTELRVVVGKGEQRELVVEVRAAPTASSPILTSPAPPPRPAPARAPTATPSDRSPNGWRTGALVTGGLGLVALTVGGITGALAIGQRDVILANCKGLACNTTGLAAAERVKGLGVASTLGVVVGVAGVGVATVLFLTEPRRPSSSPARSARAQPKRTSWVSAGVAFAGSTWPAVELQGRW